MKIINKELIIETKKELEIITITDKIREFFNKTKISNGTLNIFSRHTTCSIKINEIEELLLSDYYNFLKTIVSDKTRYNHDIIEKRKTCPSNEPKNAAGHLRCLLLECFQSVPIINNNLMLGNYQEIFLIETSGPRNRKIILQAIGE
jgi:secondary thiamine-phosphate synthase enzyme